MNNLQEYLEDKLWSNMVYMLYDKLTGKLNITISNHINNKTCNILRTHIWEKIDINVYLKMQLSIETVIKKTIDKI